VAAHTGQCWTAAFGGFVPGFTYLAGEDGRLTVPRRNSPRTAVPAGSVALGGEFSAVYPRQSPGGWQLIGHTTAVMWDLGRVSPALVRPGDTVRYVAVRQAIDLAALGALKILTCTQAAESDVAAESDAGGLLVEATGLQPVIQDLGRPGLGDLGVSAAGSADQQSARQANRLVGNQATSAVVENAFGGLALRASGDQVLAVTGAPLPLTISAGPALAPGAPGVSSPATTRHPSLYAPFAPLDGETLTMGAPKTGLRSYVAVRGGVDVPPVLGSRSTDSMSGVGPAPLNVGTRLPVDPVPPFQLVGSPESSTLRLEGTHARPRVTLGPRDDWFDNSAVRTLTGQDWPIPCMSG
jgi:hypothetical protein